MESFNKNTNSQLPPLPPLPPSHLGWQSSSANSPIIPLAPPSYDISGIAADKAKGLALAPETTHEPNSEIQVVDLEDEDLEEMDAKQQKKVLASREYSLRYRVKQAAYVTKLENEVKVLQTEIAVNTPRVKYAGHRNKLLRAENHTMRQKLSAYTDELKFKQAQHEALVKERDSLRQLHQALLQQGAAEAFNPPDYQMANLGLDQPGFGLGLADQFTGPAGLVDTLMLSQPADDLNQYGWPGQSFVEMNDLDMPNMGTFIDPFEMNHLGIDMDDHMAMNPLNMINNDGGDDADLQDPAGPSFRFM
ncbi:unnamed protein product [Prunus brigantina]